MFARTTRTQQRAMAQHVDLNFMLFFYEFRMPLALDRLCVSCGFEFVKRLGLDQVDQILQLRKAEHSRQVRDIN